MLVILGDLLLGAEKVGTEKVSGTFFDSYSQTGPTESVDLLLLGDVLDVMGSAEWLATEGRPWDDPHSPALFETVSRIVDGILRHNAAALGRLRQLARDGAIIGGQRVPVRIHYMVGDRDWPLHLPGPRYAALRSRVIQQMGLANRPELPFPHEPGESAALLDLFHRHHMLARHGDIYDPLHFDEHRDAASLGDALAIELIARFKNEVRQKLAEQLPAETVAGLAELANVRPLLAAPAWIDRVLDRTCCESAARSNVRRLWNQLVDRLLQLNFVRTRETWRPVNLVDALSSVLTLGGRKASGSRRSIVEWLSAAGNATHSRVRRTLANEDLRDTRPMHVVYGHSHCRAAVLLPNKLHSSRRIWSTTLSEFVPGSG